MVHPEQLKKAALAKEIWKRPEWTFFYIYVVLAFAKRFAIQPKDNDKTR